MEPSGRNHRQRVASRRAREPPELSQDRCGRLRRSRYSSVPAGKDRSLPDGSADRIFPPRSRIMSRCDRGTRRCRRARSRAGPSFGIARPRPKRASRAPARARRAGRGGRSGLALQALERPPELRTSAATRIFRRTANAPPVKRRARSGRRVSCGGVQAGTAVTAARCAAASACDDAASW
jgi:hypothetical protein